MDLLTNLQRYLQQRFDQFHVLLFHDFNTEAFLRIIPIQCDKTLVLFPLVEVVVRILQNQDFKICLVNFKREQLSSHVLSTENEHENICILVRKLLLDTSYGVCEVNHHFFLKGLKVNRFTSGFYKTSVEEPETSERVEARRGWQ